jgi:hypothetical protein
METNMPLGRRKKIICGGAATEISKCPDVLFVLLSPFILELLFFYRANVHNPFEIKKLAPTIRKRGSLT